MRPGAAAKPIMSGGTLRETYSTQQVPNLWWFFRAASSESERKSTRPAIRPFQANPRAVLRKGLRRIRLKLGDSGDLCQHF